jgi:hypothetical protein
LTVTVRSTASAVGDPELGGEDGVRVLDDDGGDDDGDGDDGDGGDDV